jgi:hypothetical protein
MLIGRLNYFATMFSMGWAEAPVFADTDISTIRFHFEPDVATVILNYVYTDEFMSASYCPHSLTQLLDCRSGQTTDKEQLRNNQRRPKQ